MRFRSERAIHLEPLRAALVLPSPQRNRRLALSGPSTRGSMLPIQPCWTPTLPSVHGPLPFPTIPCTDDPTSVDPTAPQRLLSAPLGARPSYSAICSSPKLR